MLRKLVQIAIPKRIYYSAIVKRSYASAGSSDYDFGGYSSDSSSDTSDSDELRIEDVKTKILEASMPFVMQHGWTSKTLALGAEKVALSNMSHGLFPSGGYELVSHFYKTCNDELEKRLKHVTSLPEKKTTRIFIEEAVKFRLELLTPYVSIWPQAMVLMALPQNLPDSLKNFGSMLDDVWYHAGDRSAYSSWYTKRIALGLVYKSTELSLINDESKNFEETWNFLSRRLDNVEFISNCSNQLPEVSRVLFETARNLMSLNNMNRK